MFVGRPTHRVPRSLFHSVSHRTFAVARPSVRSNGLDKSGRTALKGSFLTAHVLLLVTHQGKPP
jgi:hypothetical protein